VVATWCARAAWCGCVLSCSWRGAGGWLRLLAWVLWPLWSLLGVFAVVRSRSCSRSLWLPGLAGSGFVLVGASSGLVSLPSSSLPSAVSLSRSFRRAWGVSAFSGVSVARLRVFLRSLRSSLRFARLCGCCPAVSCSCCWLGASSLPAARWLPALRSRWLPAVRGCVAVVAVSALWAWRGFGASCVVVRSFALVCPAWLPVFGLGARVRVRSVPASSLRLCRPAVLGGRRGLFGSASLLGALCAPWPLSPVSRRVVLWAVSCLVFCPGCACSFFSLVPASVLARWRSVLASALGCPAPLSSGSRVRAWCAVVGGSLWFSLPPVSALGGGCVPVPSSFGGVRGVVASFRPVAAAVARVVSSACSFLASGGVPVGGLSPRRPALACLLRCLSWFVRG